jgi:hypothetical protein
MSTVWSRVIGLGSINIGPDILPHVRRRDTRFHMASQRYKNRVLWPWIPVAVPSNFS